jgi:2-succinyl-5-enolpyruvyl-6-hydroxy-3-cyclohexene-1-carboxylate synthase
MGRNRLEDALFAIDFGDRNHPMTSANRNLLWTETFASALVAQGLQDVCLAPGSRSTPLVFAFAQQANLRLHIHSDERSAAYFALGLARTSQRPVALICTSGTAAANFFPAIVEANYSEIPLIVLTADRPAEARESGANQTIDQIKLYGNHVRWFVDVAPPEANARPLLLRYLQTLAARAWFSAQAPLPGPVHLNFPFRKPLEPTPVAGDLPDGAIGPTKAIPTLRLPRLAPDPEAVEALSQRLLSAPSGLIVCGPRCPQGDFPALITRLAGILRYPILADALSGVRFGPHTDEHILGLYDLYLSKTDVPRPDLILRFGDVPTSTLLGDYLEKMADVPQIAISETGRWRDDRFVVSEMIWADPLAVCRALLERLAPAAGGRESDSLEQWIRLERASRQRVAAIRNEAAFEAGILLDVLDQLAEGSSLYVANSLPVRHLDQFVPPQKKTVHVFANRGASGIDGTLSSALGAAVAHPGLVFVSGDTSFYHDMNGLLALRRERIRATIVVINNDGGGIFHRLPVAQFDPPFREAFLAPHSLTFEHAAALYGLRYAQVTRQELPAVLQAAIAAETPTLIEVPSDAAAFEKLRKNFQANNP